MSLHSYYAYQDYQSLAFHGIRTVCIYPITNYPAWDDKRNCETGLLSQVSLASGSRSVYQSLADELLRQQIRFQNFNINGQLYQDIDFAACTS